jgi:hypothetical protein
VPSCSPFHTSEPEYPAVYHDNSACDEGKKIKRQHRVEGSGGRRICYVCHGLNSKGE